MKFRIILSISASLTFAAAAHAKENTIIKLDNGSRLSVEICSESTAHIRISHNGTFSESLLERYGIIKTDWDDFKVFKTVKNGAIAESKFECSEKADGIEVRILPVVGKFEGMPEMRSYSLEIDAKKPSEVTVNGTPTKFWTFGDDGKVHIDLPECSVHAEYIVNLK